MMAVAQKRPKKIKKVVTQGVAHILATFNNTHITIADVNGNVLAWSTSGTSGFKGSRKSTPFAAQVAVENAAKKAMAFGIQKVQVKVKGPGSGREAAVRALQAVGLEVTEISDETRLPHNGVRPPKSRRV